MANRADGTIVIETKLSDAELKKGLKNAEKTASSSSEKASDAIKKNTKSAGDAAEKNINRIEAAFKKVAKVVGTAFAFKQIASFAADCINLGSALSEVENVTSTVFPHMTEQLDKFTQSAAESAGLSETMAKQYLGTFGAMAESFGFSENAAYKMSKTLTQLSGDVASFYNLTNEESFNKLKSVFTGETESLKSLGVVMTQTALDEYALANGIGKTTANMSESEKVALRYQFVMSKLSNASGDFEKTSDGWANSMRKFNLYIGQIKTNLGQGFINLFTPILQIINKLLQGINQVAKAFKAFTELITGNKLDGSTSQAALVDTEDLGSVYSDAATGAEDYADSQKDVANATKKAAKAAKSYESPLDHINKIQAETDTTPSNSSKSTKTPSASMIGAINDIDYGRMDTTNTKLDSLSEKVKTLWESCKKYLQPAAEAFTRFKNALKPITQKLGDGMSWIYKNVLVPLAKFTITEVVPRFFDSLSAVLGVINPILDALKPLWQWFWEYVLQPIAKFTAGVFLSVWDKIIDLLTQFGNWCKNNPEKIQNITIIIASFFAAFKITEIIGKIGEFIRAFGGIGTVVELIGGMISTVFANPWVIAIAAVIAAIVLIAKNWDKVKDTVIKCWESLKTKAKTIYEAITKSIKTAWDNIKKACETTWNNLTTFLSNSWNLIKEKAGNAWDAIKATITGVWDGIKTYATTIWDGIKTTVTGVWNGLTSAATTAFDNVKRTINSAWDGVQSKAKSVWEGAKSVKDIVVGALNSIADKAKDIGTTISNALRSAFENALNFIKTPINGIIGVINTMIRGLATGINNVIGLLNRISVKVPSWVPHYGGKTFGFNIPTITSYPQIPYLAKGAVIPPNAPFAAVLGDQKQGTNIETPEKLLRDIVASESGKGTYRFTAQINRRVLFDEVITEAKLRRQQSGTNPFEMAY